MSVENFHNFGYLLEDLPEEIKNLLNQEVSWMEDNFDECLAVNKTLAGHIKREFKLRDEVTKQIEQYVLSLALQFNKEFGYFEQLDFLNKNVPMCVEHCWVNFQAKHEFNPIHNHNGILSFVSWIKIPYDLEREFAEGPGQYRATQINSDFQFLYVNSIGQIATKQLKVDKSFENKIMIFPAKLLHCVYPFFTSDEYRVSIAGNVMLNAK